MEIGCDGVIIRLKTNIGNGYIRSYDARMMLHQGICFGLRMHMSHQGNMLRFTDSHACVCGASVTNMLRFTDSHACVCGASVT